MGATHVHFPTKAPRHAYRLDLHENKDGTVTGSGQAHAAVAVYDRAAPRLAEAVFRHESCESGCGHAGSTESQG
jgi:hypothetical protein